LSSTNGQPAAAAYHRDEDGVLRAFGIAVLDVTAAGIARIVVFGEPGLVTLFGLPLVTSPLDAAGNSRPG
jgi:RNA polymerase sigma-70 factor, ECF subfamily